MIFLVKTVDCSREYLIMMKTLTRTSLLLATLLTFSMTAFALTLQEAKEQGLVGEQRDGYVGFVVSSPPADVVALVEQVNNERRSRYQEIAQENGITVNQVAAVAYERAVQATQAGHFVQNANGQWVRK